MWGTRLPGFSWFITGFLVILCLTAGLWPAGVELVVFPVNDNVPLMELPMEPGERFILHYIHSVDNTPVWESHSIDASGTIYIEEERFVMFGAGMGHWEGHGTLTKRGSFQVIENIHEPVGQHFRLRVGSMSSPHTIIWRGSMINLSSMASGKALHIYVHRISFLEHIGRSMYKRTRTIPVSGEHV